MKLTEYIIDNLLGAIVGNALGTALVLFYAPEIRAIIYFEPVKIRAVEEHPKEIP